jgi:hypothetical protein
MFGFETTATRIVVCAPPFEDEPAALLDDEELPHPATVTTTAPSPTAPLRRRSTPRP